MAEFEESPFQMDEDFGLPPEVSLSQPKSSFPETFTARNGGHVTHPVPGDMAHLRSRLAGLKAEDNIGTTTEEDEIVYEEDLDDKFDGNAGETMSLQITSQEVALESETVTPPENFAPVVNKIYRLSFPQTQNFGFLKKLRLKSVLCLIPEEYPQAQLEFFEKEGIRLFQLGMSGNKEPFVKISSELITKAIKIVINPENQPILIHCNRGKHRTGCLVGVLRRLQGWSLTIIFDEYRKFAAPKERPMDQQFIELYDETGILEYAEENKFLPMAWL
ncbi:tyrosine-protein phosphatase SIW14 [Metschnikowia aff. pulcherrima]|uniref:diphosphoinositol-polyphosphate diphosphatase n=1 Tax=Metschnikowia aff. pulcherrima TaxID=2163413 RepID=A0A4P6XPZ8_9ASCO|nr:tyrosine-protein phosphatase SIW14 [Metschnikowia aff. pulcherrima]